MKSPNELFFKAYILYSKITTTNPKLADSDLDCFDIPQFF